MAAAPKCPKCGREMSLILEPRKDYKCYRKLCAWRTKRRKTCASPCPGRHELAVAEHYLTRDDKDRGQENTDE